MWSWVQALTTHLIVQRLSSFFNLFFPSVGCFLFREHADQMKWTEKIESLWTDKYLVDFRFVSVFMSSFMFTLLWRRQFKNASSPETRWRIETCVNSLTIHPNHELERNVSCKGTIAIHFVEKSWSINVLCSMWKSRIPPSPRINLAPNSWWLNHALTSLWDIFVVCWI